MDLFRLAGDENYDKVCGQILFTTKGRLAYYCTLCGQYWSYEAFIMHLLENCCEFVDDDLKECISLKSLTGKTQKPLNHFTKRCMIPQVKTMVKRSNQLHNGSSAIKAENQAEFSVQMVETFTSNQDESMDHTFTPHQFGLEEHPIDNESINEDLIEVDYCDENINEYENFEYLEDEPIGEEVQNNFVFKNNEDDEMRSNNLQSSDEQKVDVNEDGKRNKKHRGNKKKNLFVDSVTVPLVVRNVQIRKKYFPSHIAPEERKFKCPVCGAAFKDRTNRNYHLRRHTNNKKHSCPDCGKKFFTSTEVRIHSRVHTKPENQFLCTECGRSFESNFKLLNHQKRHTNQRDYICKECDKGFFQLEGLKAHMAVHSTDRPYTCAICKASFKRPHILKSHMKQHENKREYQCQLCEAAFNVQAGLHSHMKTRHRELVQVD